MVAQGYDGDVEQYRIPSLSLKNTLQEVHVVDVTCIDYRSDGEYLLTGDESGRWAVWDLQGHRQGPYRDYGQEILDCKFSQMEMTWFLYLTVISPLEDLDKPRSIL